LRRRQKQFLRLRKREKSNKLTKVKRKDDDHEGVGVGTVDEWKRKVPKFSGLNQASPSPFKGSPACVKIRHCGAVVFAALVFFGFSFVHDSPGVPDKLKRVSSLVFIQQGKFFTGPEICTYTTACMEAPAQGCVGLLMLFLPWAFSPHPTHPGWSCDRHHDSSYGALLSTMTHTIEDVHFRRPP
jgi:hypothetical protein